MPIYEFECHIHGKFERIFSLSMYDEIKDGVMCEYDYGDDTFCGEIAELQWSLPANNQIAAPTRIFVSNRTGDFYTPASRYEKPPRGFHEKELKGSIERTKFEHEHQKKVDERNQFMSHHLNIAKEERRKKRHDELNAKMNAVQVEHDEKGNRIEYTLDHKEKALLKKAMNRTKKRPMREKKSDVMFAVNHQNSSNLDEVK